MKTFYCTSFEGHYPVGAAALIVAQDVETAKIMLEQDLKNSGLDQEVDIKFIIEFDPNFPTCRILVDGDY